MQALTIRDLQTNPSKLTQYLGRNESVFVTKHGVPIGITIPLNDDVLSLGIKKAGALELYKRGAISMGKCAEILNISKNEMMKLLNDLKIIWIEDDVSTTKEEIKEWL